MKKTIVTHIFPDLDAISAIWLLKRFDSEFEGAEIKLVPAGSTLEGKEVDSDPAVVHVDTGMGKFDHHHLEERTCAAEQVFNYLKSKKRLTLSDQRVIKRLVALVTVIDQFEEFFWDSPADDRYDFCLHQILDHLKMSGRLNDQELVSQGMLILDAIFYGLKQKVKAEEEIKKGRVFKTIWGKSIGLETQVGRVKKLAQKLDYSLVVKKEPETGFVVVTCQPRKELDLTLAFKALKAADPKADWFFHQSRHIIVNGSRHNPEMRVSSLSLEEIIEILTGIK